MMRVRMFPPPVICQVLYVGDHVFSDVNIAKASNRWRTLLILQVISA